MSEKSNSTSSNSSEKWLAAYLYYAEPWEALLIKGVKPFAEQMREQGLVSQYFFIRYWENGPHVRLRFKGGPEVLENEVKPQLIEHFETYFRDNPSEREDPEWLKEASEEYQWFPNNSLQFIEYEPEIERYGGDQGILVAEQQFQGASDAILAVIEEGLDSWDYNRALGAAIQLHLGFAYALGMDQEEATCFFSKFFENWLPRAYYFFEKDISQEELDKRRTETLNAFESNFEAQQESLVPFFQTVWEAFEEEQSFDQEWLNQWLVDMKAMVKELKKIHTKGQLVMPKYFSIDESVPMAAEKQQLWAIYDSYIHMINNRLGIMNRDEGYLAYLMRESFKVLPNSVK